MATVKLEILGQNKASGAIKGVISDMVKATLSAAMLRRAFSFVVDVAKESVEGYDKLQKSAESLRKEGLGKLVNILAKDLVSALNKGTEALNGFLSNSENLAKIGGSLEVVKSVVKDMANNAFKVLREEAGKVWEKFKDLLPKIEDSGIWMKVLAGAIRLASMGISVMIKVLSAIIQGHIEWIKALKEVGKLLVVTFQALFDPTKWGEVKKQLDKTGDAFLDFGKNIFTNTKDIITGIIEEFKALPENVKNDVDKMTKIYEEAGKKIIAANEEIKKNPPKLDPAPVDTFASKMSDAIGKIQATWNQALGMFNQVSQTIQMYFDDMYENSLDKFDEWKESHLSGVEDWMNRELEMYGVREETDRERIERELTSLNDQLAGTKNAKDRAAIQETIAEKNKELQRAQILEAAENKKEKIEKEYAKKSLALRKKQFEQQKAYQIAMVWVNAASASLGWFASFASSPGGFLGLALAIAASAATLVMAGVQTGIIAGQSFKGAKGGVIPGNSLTGDMVPAQLNSMERILTPEQNKTFEDMVYGGRGGGNIYISQMTVVSNDPNDFARQMNDIRRYEVNR